MNSQLIKDVKSGLTISATFIVSVLIFGTISAAISQVNEGDPLTATKWNEVVDSINGVTTSGKNIQAFTTAGTSDWIVPTGVTRIFAEVWGGGGGGGGGYLNQWRGEGGGGGGYSAKYFDVTPGQSISITVGAGGGGGSVGAAGTAGGAGGTSSILTISATGGAGGIAGLSNWASEGVVGGIGSGGDINQNGGQSMLGPDKAAGNGIGVSIGGDGAHGGGSGGRRNVGYAGVAPGGGGAGGNHITGSLGGAGARGEVRIGW